MRGAAGGWWARKQLERAKLARTRMLEYQQAKSASLRRGPDNPIESIRAYTRHVRELIEQVQRIPERARVLEVGSGAHGHIFFFDDQAAFRGVGVDPLAHEYTHLFPLWQHRSPVVAACGEALPFPDACFDVAISDNVVDHAGSPARIMAEIARVLKPGGTLYFEVNVSHPIYAIAAAAYAAGRAFGWVREVVHFSHHVSHLSLSRARRLVTANRSRIVWERHEISRSRAHAGRDRRLRRLFRWLFYFQERFECVASRGTAHGSVGEGATS